MSLCQRASSATLPPGGSLLPPSVICRLLRLFSEHFYGLVMSDTRFWEHSSRRWGGVRTDLGVGLGHRPRWLCRGENLGQDRAADCLECWKAVRVLVRCLACGPCAVFQLVFPLDFEGRLLGRSVWEAR